ncbi:TFIIB zinc-binding protein [Streptomyces sp. TLI_171]|nr:TFIIB zinc-binding protein [Streptomyces sp. TLI_171]
MAKGHKCPNCGKNTLQPYTTNQLRCSSCDTIVKKDRLS